MTSDATPDTPDPREVAHDVAIEAARVYSRSIQRDLWAPMMFATSVAKQVVDALADARLLVAPGRVAQDAEQVAITALDRMGASPAWRNADARAIVRDLRAAGLLREPTEGEGSLRSQASGTPDGYVAFNGDSDHLYSSAEDVETFINEMAEPGDDWRIYEVRAAFGTPTTTQEVERP